MYRTLLFEIQNVKYYCKIQKRIGVRWPEQLLKGSWSRGLRFPQRRGRTQLKLTSINTRDKFWLTAATWTWSFWATDFSTVLALRIRLQLALSHWSALVVSITLSNALNKNSKQCEAGPIGVLPMRLGHKVSGKVPSRDFFDHWIKLSQFRP